MQLHGVMRVMGLLCAIIALAMFAGTAQASSSRSAVAGTPAKHAVALRTQVQRGCTRTTEKRVRALSSAKASRLRMFCGWARTHASTVRFWLSSKHRWTLYTKHADEACWQLSADVLRGPRSLCLVARAQLRLHKSALSHLNKRIKALLPKPRPRLVHDWLFHALVCIHGKEGAWNAIGYVNHRVTYYGGLQMDLTFQRQYGPDFLARWGTADHWPAWAQMTAATRAYKGWPQAPDPRARSPRGFGPWPHTAIGCHG